MICTYTIPVWSEDSEFSLKNFRAAKRCQSQIAPIAQEGSLAHRSLVITEEFCSEVHGHIKIDLGRGTETFLTPQSPYGITAFQALTDGELFMVLNGFLNPGISLVEFELESCIESGDL